MINVTRRYRTTNIRQGFKYFNRFTIKTSKNMQALQCKPSANVALSQRTGRRTQGASVRQCRYVVGFGEVRVVCRSSSWCRDERIIPSPSPYFYTTTLAPACEAYRCISLYRLQQRGSRGVVRVNALFGGGNKVRAITWRELGMSACCLIHLCFIAASVLPQKSCHSCLATLAVQAC